MLIPANEHNTVSLNLDKKSSRWSAKHAIILHTSGDLCAATLHDVNADNTFTSGSMVSIDAVQGVVSKMVEQSGGLNLSQLIDGAWVDPRVVFSSSKVLVWENKPQKRTLWFRVNGEKPTSIEASLPRLVFVLNRGAGMLSVFACPQGKAISQDTKLYVAPLMNTSENGSFCLGSAHLPEQRGGTSTELLNACEGAVFDSLFTHINSTKTFRSKSDIDNKAHIKKWGDFAKRGRTPTMRDLSPASFETLGQLLLNNLRG